MTKGSHGLDWDCRRQAQSTEQDTEQERAEFIRWHMDASGAHEMGSAHVWDNNHLVALAWQAARRAPVVPQGWMLVPAEPCTEMRLAGKQTIRGSADITFDGHRAVAIYRAMIAAAPQPPEAAAVDLALLSAIQRAGFMLVKGALGFELLKASQAVAQAAQTEVAPVQLPEPDAWRYTDANGNHRYRGRRKGFAAEYQRLKPEPLYTGQQVRQLLEAQARKG